MRKNKAGRRSTRNPSIESGQRWRQKNTGEIAAVVKADQFRVTFVRGVEAEKSIARALFEKHFEFESAAEARDEVVFSEARDRLLATHRRHTKQIAEKIEALSALPKPASVKERRARSIEIGAWQESAEIESYVGDLINDTTMDDRSVEERVKGMWMRAHNIRFSAPR